MLCLLPKRKQISLTCPLIYPQNFVYRGITDSVMKGSSYPCSKMLTNLVKYNDNRFCTITTGSACLLSSQFNPKILSLSLLLQGSAINIGEAHFDSAGKQG